MLTGCGFKTLYNQDNFHSLSDISYQRLVDNKNDARITFLLNEKIERMLVNNTKTNLSTKYFLSVDYDVKIEDYMTTPGSVSTRKRVQVSLYYVLRDKQTDQEKYKGKIMDFNSFSLTKEQPFTDYLSQNHVTINMLNSLVEELRIQLIAKLAN